MDIKQFAENFFKNLKAEISWKDGILFVDKVPKEFEAFAGKKSPYLLAFGPPSCPINPDVEVITKGSVFLKAMFSFLDGLGQTTLLKINFEPLNLSLLKLNNCRIIKSSLKQSNNFIFRFTFQTTFQFMNEKEQKISTIFVGAPENFNPSEYRILEGKKSEISIPDIKPAYDSARLRLRELTQPRIQEIGNEINKKLEGEIKRIKDLFKNQFLELDQEIKKAKSQLADLEKGQTSGDVKNIPQRMNKLQEHIEELEKRQRLEKSGDGPIAKEEKFFIADELNKHSLNVDNKLMNTTIIYYPVYNYAIMLKNDDAGRQVELNYNPLKKTTNSFECESCKAELIEFTLCASGHLTCRNCIQKCRDCGKEFCSLCLDKSCAYCGKKICRKCAFKCGKCGKTYCSTHTKKTQEGRQSCTLCTKICAVCGQASDFMKKCPSCNQNICSKCSQQLSGSFCFLCSVKCPTCQSVFSKRNLARCSGCKAEVCHHLNKCIDCRRQLCIKLKKI
jgi:hypothetical protein